MEELSMANTVFALNIFKHIEQTNSAQNIFFSPWSISSTLAMVFLGARGNTEHQMAKELNSDKVEEMHSDFQTLAAEVLKPGNSYILKTANRIYGEKTYPFHNKYMKDMQTYFGAEPQSVNFVGASGQIRTEINSWVENQTEGKIPNLLPDDSVDSMTRMVLVNALYFKGTWEHQFSVQNTTERPFRINKQEKKTVQMMFKHATFMMGHVDEVNMQVLVLPYAEEELCMVVLLPDENTDLAVVEKALTYEKFRAWTNPENMTESKVQVFFPRLKLEESYDLESFLQSLGMTDAFEETKADFSGMATQKNVPVSKVAHKCFVEVNEEGTEAAATTAVIRNARCCRIEPRFCADHPFLFFIWHQRTSSILFCGRFSSP
ncbi:Serpin B8 [Lemmus lemmus]